MTDEINVYTFTGTATTIAIDEDILCPQCSHFLDLKNGRWHADWCPKLNPEPFLEYWIVLHSLE